MTPAPYACCAWATGSTCSRPTRRATTSAQVLGRGVPVLAIPRAGEESPGLTNGALVVLGLPDITAQTVAQASVTAFLSVLITR